MLKFRKNIFFIYLLIICLPQIVFADISLAETILISAQVVPTDSNQGGNGSSGGSSLNLPAVVNFSGISIPKSTIYFLRDGQLVATTIAFDDGYFSTQMTIENTSSYNFSIYGQDSIGQKSAVISFPVYVKRGTIVSISNIFLTFPVKEIVTNKCESLIADLNCDGHVDLTDYTIMHYWYQKNNFPSKVDLNFDGKISLMDFSIMMYYWTD